MKNFKIGLQLYSVRDAMANDFEGTLRLVRDMGYEYVEFAGYFGKSGEEIKSILDSLGLKCVSVHQGLSWYWDDPIGKVNYLKSFGVKYGIIPWYEKGALAGSDKWEETKKSFNEAADLLAENGMLLGYHNHDFEFDRFDGEFIHDHIMKSVPEEKFFPEIDTCWVRYAGLSPEDKIREFSGRVPIVHLKDFTCKTLAAGPAYDLIGADEQPTSKEDNEFTFCPVGYGMQNFDAILEACEDAGSEILIVEQDQPRPGCDPLDEVKLSREYIKSHFGI